MGESYNEDNRSIAGVKQLIIMPTRLDCRDVDFVQ